MGRKAHSSPWVLRRGRGAGVPLSLRTLLIFTLPSPKSFVPCSEKIHLAVTEMASLFPKVQGPERGAGLGGSLGGAGAGNVTAPWVRMRTRRATLVARGWKSEAQLPPPIQRPALEPVRSSLRLLNASACRLQSECRKTVPPEPGAPVDFQLLTQQVIQCAYDIAKAAKQLVTITTREKKQ